MCKKFPVCGPGNIFQGPGSEYCRPGTTKFMALLRLKNSPVCSAEGFLNFPTPLVFNVKNGTHAASRTILWTCPNYWIALGNS
jgi:hypothetical protein